MLEGLSNFSAQQLSLISLRDFSLRGKNLFFQCNQCSAMGR